MCLHLHIYHIYQVRTYVDNASKIITPTAGFGCPVIWVMVLQVKMMAPNKPGTVKLDVFVKSDSYMGLDQQKAVEFEVISAATLPQYEPHPDDLELDNEPTLFEQVMQAYDDETDSEDEVRKI